MSRDERLTYGDALACDPDLTIRGYLEIMAEIDAILASFEIWPINFGWRDKNNRIQYERNTEDKSDRAAA